jgi:hypothetical protein
MKRLFIVVTLVCILSGTALAGEMPGGGKPLGAVMPGDGTSVAVEVPRDDPAILDETESSLITTLLVTLFLLGR